MSELKLSQAGIDFIKKHEFFVPHYYLDSAGIPTIGYGTTTYEDGSKPKKGDIMTEETATHLLLSWVNKRAAIVSHSLKTTLNQNQQDALISILYNIGVGNVLRSHFFKLININPNDPAIEQQWLEWNEATINGKRKVLPGLANRRKAEYHIYNS